MTNGARLTIESLKKEGVKVIFGIPGLTNMPLYDAFLEDLQNGELKHVLMRHEQGAAHAADGYARATGLPGVCTATSGPGTTNLVTGIITAYQDSSPVIAITGQVVRPSIGKLSFQEADTPGIFAPITKYTVQVRKASQIPGWIRNGFHIATTGRPGPVVIDIPRDVLLEEVGDEIKVEPMKGYMPFRTNVTPEKIKEAALLMAKAERPVILVGAGAVWANATEEILKLAEMLISPIVSTLPGKSAIPHDHPLYAGPMGYYGRAEATKIALESDLIIAIGARLSDRTATSAEEIKSNRKIIMVNIDPTDSEKTAGVDLNLVGDARGIIKDLRESLITVSQRLERSEWISRLKELKEYYSKFYYEDERPGLRPWKVLKILRNTIPRDSIVTTGVGQHQMWAEVFWDVLEPRTFISSTGMGTMGFGLPAAMGAKIARPEKTVVDIDGDGSFLMTATNLATAVDEGIPIISVIMDNRTLGLVRQVQDLFQSRRIVGVDYGNSPDFVKLAEAFGAAGFEAASYDELERTVKTAMAQRVPSVIRVPIDRDELALPTLPPGGKLSQVIVSDPRKSG